MPCPLHSPGHHRVEHHIRDAVDESRQLTQRVKDDRQYVAHTGQDLQAIGETNHAVITLVTGEVVLVHGVQSRGGHAGANAAERLQAQTQVRAGGFATASGLEAAAALGADVSLAAEVLAHVVVQDLSAENRKIGREGRRGQDEAVRSREKSVVR